MKIEIEGKHWGLVNTLKDIFEEDHQVSVVEANTFPARFGLVQHDWKPDVHISTFPYDDIKNYDKTIPLILYATDPVYEWNYKDVVEIQKWKGCLPVAAEPCYGQRFWPINYKEIIPFTINPKKYYPWTGGINKVAVVNRKAQSRWMECIRIATGIPYTLEHVLEDIPFDIFSFEGEDEYRKALSQYDVMLYFSNSPYTLVMFEGMSIGMPMIGYNACHNCLYKPMEKYIKRYSTDPDEIRKMLRSALANPIKEKYPILPFEDVRQKWNRVIKEIYDRTKRL